MSNKRVKHSMLSQSAPHLWVLGLNIGLHDSSAAILRDGELIAMAEQERFSRNKRAIGEPPVDAILFCLDTAGISLDEVTAVGLGSDMQLLDQWHGLTQDELAKREKIDNPERLFPKNILKFKSLPPLVPIRHHLAHAASTFWVSGFDEAAILIVDNRGENSSTTLAHGTSTGIKILEEYGVPVSLGLYYRTAAQYAGLCGKYREVGKFMGLAAYGQPNQIVPLRCGENGPFLDGIDDLPALRGIEIPPYRTKQLMEYFTRNCFPFSEGTGEEVMAYSNFAASVQLSLEKTLLALCQRLRKITSSNNLAMAGGTALNCTANGMISNSGLFDKLFIQPASHDAGVALGAALEVTRQFTSGQFLKFEMRHAYWGPEYTQEQINAALKQGGLIYKVLNEDELVRQVAHLLAEHKIVGWFQGRAEVGPRALGARSLLGNPMSRNTLIRLNTIKSREMWRPLAPSVLKERFSEFFIGSLASPFMIVAAKVRPIRQRDIPAIVHVDGSARPQAASRHTNQRYWKLIRSFEEKTGIPIIVNTSFNTEGEPIVNTPEDAVKDFLKTDIDALAIGDALVKKTVC
jgi:carbamoyltransferase